MVCLSRPYPSHRMLQSLSLRSSETSLNPNSVGRLSLTLITHSIQHDRFPSSWSWKILLTRWPRIQPYSPCLLSVSIIPVILALSSQFSNAGHHQVNYLDKNYSFVISILSAKSLVAGAFVLFIYFIAKLWTTGCREQGFPPGPPVTPVVGNTLQFPTGFPHIRCAQVHPITVYSISTRCSLILNAPDLQNGHIRMVRSFLSVAYQPPE